MKKLSIFTVLLLFALPVFATPIIDFGTGTAPRSGVYTLLAGGNASGADIPLGIMNVSGAPMNNGGFDTSGACEPNTLFADSNGSACLSFNTAANTITVVGGIPALGISNPVTLLSGSFVSFTANNMGILAAMGPDTKNPALLGALGLTSGYQFTFFGFSLTAQETGANTGIYDVVSTDFRNSGAVPEPATLALLGPALILAAWLRRKRPPKP